MDAKITSGIRVIAEPTFDAFRSKPDQHQFIYTYQITIENLSDDIVQLISRHWYIVDAKGYDKEVEGEGVVGEFPILKPGESFTYSSWCLITSVYGKMWGTYTMERKSDGALFEVLIPEFQLSFPPQLN